VLDIPRTDSFKEKPRFTEEQVYWECSGGSFCEESHFDFWTSKVSRFCYEPSSILPSQTKPDNLGETPAPEPESATIAARSSYEQFSEQYWRLVLRYSHREITDDNDYLHAFTGALYFLAA
jgi:hypothetical protein